MCHFWPQDSDFRPGFCLKELISQKTQFPNFDSSFKFFYDFFHGYDITLAFPSKFSSQLLTMARQKYFFSVLFSWPTIYRNFNGQVMVINETLQIPTFASISNSNPLPKKYTQFYQHRPSRCRAKRNFMTEFQRNYKILTPSLTIRSKGRAKSIINPINFSIDLIYITLIFPMQEIVYFPIFYYYVEPECPQTITNPRIQPCIEVSTAKKVEEEVESEKEKERWRNYLEIFQKQLIKNKEKYEKKAWTVEQDELLIQLRQKSQSWVQISKQISKTNPQVCKRRHTRLCENEKKWPKLLDDMIRTLYDDEGKRWSEIQEIISSRAGEQFSKYGVKKIKERYFLHLRAGIEQRDWDVEEDLALLTLVKQNGKKWKDLTANFTGRTELQLKNRYNGTLKLIEKRVLRKLNFLLKSKSTRPKLKNP